MFRKIACRSRCSLPAFCAKIQLRTVASNRILRQFVFSRNLHNISKELGKGELSLEAPVYIVWGANTDVGKTLISAGICYAASQISVLCKRPDNICIICIENFAQGGAPVFYYKPAQTGFPEDSDSDVVAGVCGGRTEFGDHACELLVDHLCLLALKYVTKSMLAGVV